MKMTELRYTMRGDYKLPMLSLPQQKEVFHGRYATMRKKYLKEQRKILYYNLLTNCKLDEHLAEIEQTATELEEKLTKEMAEKLGLNEELKATDILTWVQMTNNIRHSVRETVRATVIYA
ncbi:MAG: TnpV protein [Ruminococcaceae bacterium]|nr:TnpV protein [Oscillospiraceae bacterium]